MFCFFLSDVCVCPTQPRRAESRFMWTRIYLISAHWATSCLLNTLFGHEDALYAGVSPRDGTELGTGACWFNHIPVDSSHTHTHTPALVCQPCSTEADSSSCLVFLHWCRHGRQWVVVSSVCVCVSGCACVCGPGTCGEPLPLPNPGCVHAYFHSWHIRPQMAAEWRWPRLLLQPDSSCLGASSSKCSMTAWFLSCLWGNGDLKNPASACLECNMHDWVFFNASLLVVIDGLNDLLHSISLMFY